LLTPLLSCALIKPTLDKKGVS